MRRLLIAGAALLSLAGAARAEYIGGYSFGAFPFSMLPSAPDQTVLGFAGASGAAPGTLTPLANDFLNVKYYSGVVGDGTNDDTAGLALAIADANTRNIQLYWPAGTYRVQPGVLAAIKVPVYGPSAYVRGINSNSGCLMTIDYMYPATAIGNDVQGYTFDFGGFADFSQVINTGNGIGLCIKGAMRSKIAVHKAILLNTAVKLDLTADLTKQFTENDLWIKADSNGYAFDATVSNSSFTIDANKFDFATSFNNVNALIRITSGTVLGATSNDFSMILEIGQPNSDGVVMTGANLNNVFNVRAPMRGPIGTGKFFRADAASCGNTFNVVAWTPTNNVLSCTAANGGNRVNAAGATNGVTQNMGHSEYVAPTVAAAVGTTIPCRVGDIIWDTTPGDGFAGWFCSVAGTPGTWTPIGVANNNGTAGQVGWYASNGTLLSGNTGLTTTSTGITTSSAVGAGNGSGFIVASSNPGIAMEDTGGGVDGKWWDWRAVSNVFTGRAVNDTTTIATNWLSVLRSGTNITSVTFPSSPVAFGTTGSVLGSTTYSGNTSGTVTVSAQAAAGTPAILWPNTSGTVATTGTAPITVSSTTGAVGCSTCATDTSTTTFTNKTFNTAGTGNAFTVNGVSLDTSWTSYTPTVTSGAGAFTTVSATGTYKQVGKTIFVRVNILITTNGTAAGRVEATLPVATSLGLGSQALSGYNDTTAVVLSAAIAPATSTTKVLLFSATGTYPGASGTSLIAQGVYEVP